MKDEMDSTFSDSGKSSVQNKRYFIDNIAGIIGDLRAIDM